MIKNVDNKFINYTEVSKKTIKYSLLYSRFLSELKQVKNLFYEKVELIKDKNWSTDDLKNKNLLRLNMDEEIKNPNFKNYIIERINREGKLNQLLEEKANNDKLIAFKTSQIKKDENILLDKYFCILCHKLPRTVLIKNCNHLVMCDNCVKTIQIA